MPLIPKPLGNHRHKVRSLSYPHNLLHWSIPCFSVRLFSRTQPTNVLPRQASRPVSPLTMWGRWVSGSGAKDGLLGFTSSTVTVRFGSIIYTYDEKGMTIYAKAA